MIDTRIDGIRVGSFSGRTGGFAHSFSAMREFDSLPTQTDIYEGRQSG